MHYNRIFLSPPHMSGREEAYIKEAFASNWIAPLGPHVTAGIGQGDIVFCSSLTLIGSVNPILYLASIPFFIDAEPDSWNISSVALEKAFKWAEKVGEMPKAVGIVDLCGQSADYDALLDICNRYGVPVVEDAAEAMGSTYKSKACGTLGKSGVYSFNGNKIIITSGGMLLSDDVEAVEKALF